MVSGSLVNEIMAIQGSTDEVTTWLQKLSGGEENSLNTLIPLIYQEMRRLARYQLRSERNNHTLCTTALVNEVYLKFQNQHKLKVENRGEFFAFASQCMRRILVDHARAFQAKKRGSGEKPISLDDADPILSHQDASEICEIDMALERLEKIFPRGSEVLQYRLFGGLNMAEIAEIMDVSTKTVQRDWVAAIAWLRKEVGSTRILSI